MNHSFRMCMGAPKYTSTCKLQHFKFFCSLCSRSINRGLLRNGKICNHFKNTLEELGHPHPIKKVFKENITSSCIVKYTTKQQRSRAMNMQYFCIRDQKMLKTFSLHGNQGKKILLIIITLYQGKICLWYIPLHTSSDNYILRYGNLGSSMVWGIWRGFLGTYTIYSTFN